MVLNTKIELCVLVLTLSWIKAQEYIENLHDSKITRLKEIPNSFELQGFDANTQFQKYFDRIQNVALHENLAIIYKVKVEIQQNTNVKHHPRQHYSKKGKSKKYNIPLKKTSMKLSNFEVWLRKMAEQSGYNKKGHIMQNFENNVLATTEGGKIITTTKQIQFKYKPIISRTKTNYTKYVKPVRSRIITIG